MYRFDVTSYASFPDGVPQFERREISLGHTLVSLMVEFDCSIPVGKVHLAWVADQLLDLDVGQNIDTSLLSITRVS